MKKVLKWIGIAFVGLIVLGAIINATKSPEQKAAEAAASEQEQAKQAEEKLAQARQEMAALPTITASDLATAYKENTVAADMQYKDKKFKISGIVTDINTNIMGDPYVTLKGGVNQFQEPQFSFEKSEAAKLANLKKGSKVTLVCIGKGDVAKTAMSDSCLLVGDDDAAANKAPLTSPQSIEPQQPSQVLPQSTNIPALVGKDPESALNDPALKDQFKMLLGDRLGAFRERLNVSSGITQEGEWVVGEGGMQHSFGVEEAAFAINSRTGETFAIMLTEGKEIRYFGTADVAKLPAPLQNWYKSHGGN